MAQQRAGEGERGEDRRLGWAGVGWRGLWWAVCKLRNECQPSLGVELISDQMVILVGGVQDRTSRRCMRASAIEARRKNVEVLLSPPRRSADCLVFAATMVYHHHVVVCLDVCADCSSMVAIPS